MVPAVPPDAHSTDWPAIIAAISAALTGLITLWYGKRAKDRQEAAATELELIKARAEAAAGHALAAADHAADAARTVQESRQERFAQIGEVRADVDGLRTEVREATHAANGYKGDIADATQATQAIAAEVKAMRQELNSQPRHDH